MNKITRWLEEYGKEWLRERYRNILCGLIIVADSNSAEQKMHLEIVLVFIFIEKYISSLLSVFWGLSYIENTLRGY